MRHSERWIRPFERYSKAIDLLTLAVALSLGGLQLYRGLIVGSIGDTRSLRHVSVALVVFGGLALYATRYWRPELFLVGAVFVGTFTVFWALRTPVSVTIEVGRLTLGVALFLLCIYQFLREQLRYERDRERESGSSESTRSGGGS